MPTGEKRPRAMSLDEAMLQNKITRLESGDGKRNGNRAELSFSTSGTSGNATVQNAGGHIINRYYVHQTALIDEGRNLKIKRKMEVRRWIYSADSDTSSNYNAARKAHLSGTGSWFLEGLQFSSWKEQPSSVLWLYGGPGSGKTILSSTVIANVIDFCDLKPLVRGYAYFFFDARNDSEQPELVVHNNLTRSLITQLADRCYDDVPPVLVDMYRICDNGHRQPSDSLLEDTLLQVIKCFEDIYIVIDSLDECAERDNLLKWIHSMASKASGKLHLLLTSRPEPAIERGLASLSNLRKVSIRDQSTASDIRTYIYTKLATMDKWNQPGEREMIEKALLSGSDGMFRWVALQVHDLNKCKNKRDLMVQLTSLPKGLDGAYARIFERSENPNVLKTLLQWLAFSRRGMTVNELAEVVAVDFDSAEGPSYDPDMRYREPEDVLITCYGLVTEVGGIIKLAHFSVKEYLIKHIQPAPGRTSAQLSHSVIAQTCLAHILHFDRPSIMFWSNDIDTSRRRIHSSFPLSRYAAAHWVSHFHSASADATDGPRLLKLLQGLFTLPQSYAMTSWVLLHDPEITDYPWKRGLTSLDAIASPLYYACFAGLTQIVQHLINNGANINAVGGARKNPLLVAIKKGHCEIGALLIKKGANVNVEGAFNITALQLASMGGHFELTKLLLENGANVNFGGGYYYKPALLSASGGGHIEIVKLLLQKGAEVKITTEYGETALQAASEGGHLDIVQLLMDNGADVNTVGGDYGSALQAASYKGRLEIVKLLLENGAELNVAEEEDSTALEAAFERGHLEIVKLLLEHEANVNAEG